MRAPQAPQVRGSASKIFRIIERLDVSQAKKRGGTFRERSRDVDDMVPNFFRDVIRRIVFVQR